MTTPVFRGLLVCLVVLANSASAAEAPFDAARFQKLLTAGQPVAIDFYASWCPTCRAQAPLLRSITNQPEFHDLTLLVADFDTETKLRKELNVSMQSTLVVFRHGAEVARSTGDTSEAGLARLLRTAIR
jgi:thioredoxin 1